MPIEVSAFAVLRLGDAEAVAGLIRAAFAVLEEAVDPLPSALGETAGSVAAGLADGGGCGVWVAGELVGAVLWQPRGGGLYVGRLSVHPDRRGQGIARRLMAAAEQAARDAGLPRLLLSTRLALVGNRALFAACGFVEMSVHAHPGHAVPTFVSLEKTLVEMRADVDDVI